MQIAILTGPVRSGKTSFLRAWSARQADIAGVLCPDGPHGRVFVDLATGEMTDLETLRPGEPIAAVGRFRFRSAAFAWANDRLMRAAADPTAPTIVIDEVGPLELARDGLAPGLRAALDRPVSRRVLVVRDTLVDRMQKAFGIEHAHVYTTATWPQQGHGDRAVP